MKDKLIQMAIDNVDNSYAPYSKFQVSAALLTKDGNIYLGNNVENSAYGNSICAERTAFLKAVTDGQRKFDSIAIVAKYKGKIQNLTWPCGSCRQVMREFVDDDFMLYFLNDENIVGYRFDEILPHSFGSNNLE